MDPTTEYVSDHFVLADFLGNHSVYTRGYPNTIHPDDPDFRVKWRNVQALCAHGLEPLLRRHGPLSISYGYISPSLSRRIVAYQDPDKPSHHRFDLGAAADICVHGWVANEADDTDKTAPIALAHAIDRADIPYSRLITYSESPYLCLALSAREIAAGTPRRAFYENRYTGCPKVKPEYRSYSTPAARERAYAKLRDEGLPHGWRGQGFPSYHGGGRRQYHHIRISRYTMLSDWLYDMQSVANGAPNQPRFDRALSDTFYVAGDAYDHMLDMTGWHRAAIVAGYVHHLNPYANPARDWRSGKAYFTLAAPRTNAYTEADLRRTLATGFAGATVHQVGAYLFDFMIPGEA